MSIATDITRIGTAKNNIKAVINKDFNKITNQTIDAYANKLQDTYDEYNTYVPWEHKNGDEFVLNKGGSGSYLKEFNLKGNIKQSILPEGYTQVNYIESTGGQYLELNKKLKNNQKVITDIEFIELGNQSFFGTYSGDSYKSVFGISNASKWEYYTGTAWTSNNIVAELNIKYNIEFYYGDTDQYLKINNDTILSSTTTLSSITSDNNAYLFARNNNGTAAAKAKIKLYSCKIYDENVLSINLIPCYRNNDNVIGLYDLINNVFYTNRGTDAFTYGSVAPAPNVPIDINVVTGTQIINISGKNLANLSIVGEVPSVSNGQMVSFPNGASSDFIQIDNTKEYVFQYDFSDTNERYIFFYDKDKNFITSIQGISNVPSGVKLSSYISFSNTKYIKLRVDKIANVNWIQLEQNSEATEYQQYYTPRNYSIDLTSKNLFDGSSSDTAGVYLKDDGTTTSGSNNLRYTDYIKIDAVQSSLTISGMTDTLTIPAICFYKKDKTFISGNALDGGQTKTVSIPSNAAYIRCSYRTTNTQTMIEYGGSATAYEPYYNYELCKIGNYKDEIKKSTGKNLFDKNNANILNSSFSEDGKKLNSSNNGKTLWIPCTSNTTYTVSKISSTRFRLLTTSETPDINVVGVDYVYKTTETSATITTSTGIKYLCVYYYLNGTDTLTEQEILDSIQIEEGSTATNYEPYGNVWYKKGYISKVVLDGSEDGWLTQKNTSPYIYALNYDNYKRTQENICKSNLFISVVNSGYGDLINNNINFRYNSGDTNKYLYICTTVASSINDFKTWLSTHNITVYYVLDTPTATEITDTDLINQLEAITQLDTYENYTAVTVIGDSVNPELEVVLFSNPAYQKWLNNQTINQEEV